MKSDKFNFLKFFFVLILILVILVGGIVYIFDPFYHYHKPWFGLTAVLNDKEYQCIGTLRNFDYDALIVGSSVTENNDNSWFDEAFDCTTIKATRSYGATADLCYLLDAAYEDHDLKYIFYNIDPSSLYASTETTYESTGCPMYLYDKNPFNDVQYLFNKDVLFSKIPYMLAQNLTGYDEALSYNWAQWKVFNSASALGLYFRPNEISDMLPENVYQTELDGNIALLTELVSSHPETEFKFFFPPYSMLWWDGSYRNGESDAVIYNEKKTVFSLLQYDNVEIYYFQDNEDIITDLEIYLDSLHFAPEINKFMCDEMAAGNDQLTLDNYEETLDNMKFFVEKIVNELIIPYDEQGLLTYEATE
ncbi:MAG: SGNH/GDSL hydrolase family protein [Butyrivibrio sp.]|nr:SGNH/GDSL hydrolase family protein [Butyrivibrio sp.]